jgi:hypothetical protein
MASGHTVTMSHFRLCYRDPKQRFGVVIMEAPSMIHARLKAALVARDGGMIFTEGHELGAEMAPLVQPGRVPPTKVDGWLAAGWRRSGAASATKRLQKLARTYRTETIVSGGTMNSVKPAHQRRSSGSLRSYATHSQQLYRSNFDDLLQLTTAKPFAGSSTCRWPRSRPWIASTCSGVRVGTSGKTGRPPGNRTSGARDKWKTS